MKSVKVNLVIEISVGFYCKVFVSFAVAIFVQLDTRSKGVDRKHVKVK